MSELLSQSRLGCCAPLSPPNSSWSPYLKDSRNECSLGRGITQRPVTLSFTRDVFSSTHRDPISGVNLRAASRALVTRQRYKLYAVEFFPSHSYVLGAQCSYLVVVGDGTQLVHLRQTSQLGLQPIHNPNNGRRRQETREGGRQDGREESASSSEFHQFRSPREREGGGVYESAHRKRLRGGSKKDGKSRLAWQSKSTSRRPILKRVLESAHDSFPFLRRGPDVKTEFVTVPAPTL